MTPLPHRLRRLSALVAVLAATFATLATTGGPSTARSAPAANTSATLAYTGTALRVKVDSPKADCERQRRVFAFARTAGGDSGGAAVGKTDGNGVFRVPVGPTSQDLKVIAYVARTPACRLAQSNAVTIEGVPIRATARARTSARLTYTGSTIRVKVTSPRTACVRDRKVDLFFYENGSEYGLSLGGTTNDDGVFRLPLSGRGAGSATRLVAFVRGTAACNVGQSNTETPQVDL